MAGRPRQFDEARALEAALEVFWERGYEAASCDELLAAMEINSGSMYSAFGDKRALFERAFSLYEQRMVQVALGVLTAESSPLQNVRNLVKCWEKFLIDGPGECRGCFLSHTVIELGKNSDDGIGERAKQILTKIQRQIENNLQAAKRAGELGKDAKPAELAAFLMNTSQGLTVMSRSGAGKEVIRGIIRTTLALISG